MAKKLSEMTLLELWQLFPIFLVEHKDSWEAQYKEERDFLASFLPEKIIINHIGSTAIPGIYAKDIVDIMAEIPADHDMPAIAELLISHGYTKMSESAGRMSFNKGYTEEGFADKVFHVHLRFSGDHDEIIFRDYLKAHPDVAHEYEVLKLGLWKKFEHDRDGYTDAKTDFIRKYVEIAKKESGELTTYRGGSLL